MTRHHDDRWSSYRPESAEERNFADVARRRCLGLIDALRFTPDMSFETMLASAYMQGANDMLGVSLSVDLNARHCKTAKPHIRLSINTTDSRADHG